jgi:hypothetical protein
MAILLCFAEAALLRKFEGDSQQVKVQIGASRYRGSVSLFANIGACS